MRRLALVVVCACGGLIKPPDPDRRLDIHVTGTMFESDRGYQLAALPEAGASVVRIDVRYPVGSADDPPGKEGLAHLVEHLLFDVETTRDGNKTSITAELGRIALAWNAATDHDHTTYQVIAVPSALDDVIRLEVDRLAVGCNGLTPEIVAREREVVLNEMRQNQGASGAETVRTILEALYPDGHPYRHVASVDTVAKLGLADVCAFIATAYRHGKATVVASGAVDAAVLQTAASHHFGRLSVRGSPARTALPQLDAKPGKVRLRVDIDEPMVIATWPLPPMASREYRLLEMAWPPVPYLLNGWGFLYGWGHSANAWIYGGERAPDEIRRDPATYREAFVLARQHVLERLVVSTTDSAAVADRLVELARYGTDDAFHAQLVEHVAALTIADLHTLVTRELAADRQVFGAFGNQEAVTQAIEAARRDR